MTQVPSVFNASLGIVDQALFTCHTKSTLTPSLIPSPVSTQKLTAGCVLRKQPRNIKTAGFFCPPCMMPHCVFVFSPPNPLTHRLLQGWISSHVRGDSLPLWSTLLTHNWFTCLTGEPRTALCIRLHSARTGTINQSNWNAIAKLIHSFWSPSNRILVCQV